MKQLRIIFVLCFATFCVSCGRVVDFQSGKEDLAYLIFTSPKKHIGDNVEVSIDDKTEFDAKVVRARKANYKGRQYGVATGTRKIKVTKNGETLFNKSVFLSSQQNKIITLP